LDGACSCDFEVGGVDRGAGGEEELLRGDPRSDGWDRTSQIVALAELLLDPFYRTIRGFEILLEKEWLSFGHMFGARTGNWLEAGASKDNEFAPIFLLFLDAVWKVTVQYPTAFEFNEAFLLLVADSVYNCRFGTFLYNSEKERVDMGLKNKTVSLWSYINSNKRNFTNPHYNPQGSQKVLFPSIQYPKLSFWNGYYLRFVRALRSVDSIDARTWQIIDENASLKACMEKLQSAYWLLWVTKQVEEVMLPSDPDPD